MIKLLFLLFPVMSFGQFTIERIAYDTGPGGNDTLWTRDGSNKDTLFRRTAGVFNFGNKPYFRRFWTSADIMDWNSLLGAKQNTLVSGTNIKTVNGNTLLGSGDVTISGAVAWGNVTGTLSSQTDLQSALDGKLATNGSAANLTSFPTLNQNTTGTSGGLSADIAQSRVTNLVSDLSGKQPTDADLTSIAAIAPANDDVIQRKAGAWTNRTMAQVKTDLVLVKGDVNLGNADNTSDANKPVSSATQTALNLKANLASPTFTGAVTFPANQIGIPVYGRVTSSNFTTTGQALVDITGLSVALTTNATYEIEAVLSVSTTAVTTGTQYGIQYSVAGGAIEAGINGSLTSTASKSERITALNTATSAYLTTSAQTGQVTIKGIVTTGANAGNLTVRTLKVTSGTSTVFINSSLKVTRIL